MKSLLIVLPIVATAVASTLERPAEDPILGSDTVHGCYSSVGELQLNETNEFNSQGSCAAACVAVGAYVAATQDSSCYCGDKYPPSSTLVDDSVCDTPCPGYTFYACGGTKAYTVINTGVKVGVANSTDSEGSTTSSSITSVASSSTLVASAATTSGTTTTAAVSGSTETSSTSTSASASTSSTAAVSTNGAVSRFSLSAFGMVILGMGTMVAF